MPFDHVDQLSAWLAATDIDVLELHGPARSLRLCRRGETVEASDEPTGTVPVARSQATVVALSPGYFLLHHPLHTTALVQPGAIVGAGQVIGLLQIGSLLLPVRAPCEGRVEGFWVAHGTAVGYGAALVELHNIGSEDS